MRTRSRLLMSAGILAIVLTAAPIAGGLSSRQDPAAGKQIRRRRHGHAGDATYAVGRSGCAGHLGRELDDPSTASREICRQGVSDRG